MKTKAIYIYTILIICFICPISSAYAQNTTSRVYVIDPSLTNIVNDPVSGWYYGGYDYVRQSIFDYFMLSDSDNKIAKVRIDGSNLSEIDYTISAFWFSQSEMNLLNLLSNNTFKIEYELIPSDVVSPELVLDHLYFGKVGIEVHGPGVVQVHNVIITSSAPIAFHDVNIISSYPEFLFRFIVLGEGKIEILNSNVDGSFELDASLVKVRDSEWDGDLEVDNRICEYGHNQHVGNVDVVSENNAIFKHSMVEGEVSIISSGKISLNDNLVYGGLTCYCDGIGAKIKDNQIYLESQITGLNSGLYVGENLFYEECKITSEDNSISHLQIFENDFEKGLVLSGNSEIFDLTHNQMQGGEHSLLILDYPGSQMDCTEEVEMQPVLGTNNHILSNCSDPAVVKFGYESVENGLFYDRHRSVLLNYYHFNGLVDISSAHTSTFIFNSRLRSYWNTSNETYIPAIYNDSDMDGLDSNYGIMPPAINNIAINQIGNNYSYNLNISLIQDQLENNINLDSDNFPFVVQVYKSNSKGDLIIPFHITQFSELDYSQNQNILFNSSSLISWVSLVLSGGVDVSRNLSNDPIGTSEPICVPVRVGCSYDHTICLGDQLDISFENSPFWYEYSGSNQLFPVLIATGAEVTGQFPNFSLVYNEPGIHEFSLDVSWIDPNGVNHLVSNSTYEVILLDTIQCIFGETDCLDGFSPTPGDYQLSAWVKEDVTSTNYDNAGVIIQYLTSSDILLEEVGPFHAEGMIIDGWQKIENVISVPSTAGKIKIILENTATHNVFFDDIRLQPIDAGMKTYVYDPIKGVLRAELDDNNFAKFYDYDDEGRLIRIRKETERGVMTIQETNYNSSNSLVD